MKRSRLAALFGACVVSATLALAPADANAWWINQPRYEKQVVTEGDPIDPGLALPTDSPIIESESSSSTDLILLIVDTLLELGS